ncbi:MAG TPA: hypothetical protein PK876_08960 [Elusimicrobiota bacterium]|nr:hypothetical protein [Elusimicrobiota bacterium]
MKRLFIGSDYSYFSTWTNRTARTLLTFHHDQEARWIKNRMSDRSTGDTSCLFSSLNPTDSKTSFVTHQYQNIVLSLQESTWWHYRTLLYEGLTWLKNEFISRNNDQAVRLFDLGWNWIVYQLYEGYFLGYIEFEDILTKEKPDRITPLSGWARSNRDLVEHICTELKITRDTYSPWFQNIPFGPDFWHRWSRKQESMAHYDLLRTECAKYPSLVDISKETFLPEWFLVNPGQVPVIKSTVRELTRQKGRPPLILTFPPFLSDKNIRDLKTYPYWVSLNHDQIRDHFNDWKIFGGKLVDDYEEILRDSKSASRSRGLVLCRGAAKVFRDFFTWWAPQIMLVDLALDAWTNKLGGGPHRLTCVRPVRVPEGAGLNWARRHEIKTISMNFAEAPDRWLCFTYDQCDQVGVVGPYVEKYCVKMGAPATGMVQMGDPRYDRLWEKDWDAVNREVRKDLNISAEGKIACVISTKISHIRSWEHLREFHSIVHDVLKNHTESVLELIKLHPKQKFDQTERRLKEWGVEPVALVQNIDIKDLLIACRFAIMNLSQAGWETLFIGKPLIVIDHYDHPDTIRGSFHMFPFLTDGTVPIVRTREELEKVVKKMLFDDDFYAQQLKKIRDFNNTHFYKYGRAVAKDLVGIFQ